MRRAKEIWSKEKIRRYMTDYNMRQVGNKPMYIDAYGQILLDIYGEIGPDEYIVLVRTIYPNKSLNNAGYQLVNTSYGLKLVHRLVAEAWLQPGLADLLTLEVDHIDNNKQNNHYTNLRFITHAENVKKSWSVDHKTPTYVGRYNRKNETLCLKDGVRIHMKPEEYVAWRIDRKLPIKGWMIPYVTKSKSYLIDDFSL